MSLVAATINQSEIKIGSDSFSTEPYNKALAIRNSKKVFAHNDIYNKYEKSKSDNPQLIFGSVGNFKDKLDFNRFLEDRRQGRLIHGDYQVKYLDEEYKLFKLFREYRKWCDNNKTSQSEHSSKFIIGCQAGLYYYDTKQVVLNPVNSFIAIGAGDREATALLAYGVSLDEVLETTCSVNKYCEPPYQLETLTLNK